MASKRQRGESSSSHAHAAEVDFDRSRFVSAEAEDFYHRVLLGKTFVLERGLKPEPDSDGQMMSMIRAKGWLLFVEPPLAAPISVVQEFYANAKITKVGPIFVRGCQVPFDSKSINAIYHLPSINPSDPESFHSTNWDTKLDRIKNTLCKPGTEWTTKQGTDQKLHFPHTALSRYGKAWYSFICANLMPTRHQNDVTRDRAILLYGIVMGKSVNVGYVIHQSIRRYLQGGTSGGIPHAAVITRLCLAAGVEWADSEPVQLPMNTIDHATIAKYKVWDGAPSHARGAGFLLGDYSESEEAEVQPVPDPEPPTHISQARLDRMERRMTRRMDAIHLSMTELRSFSTQLSDSFSQAFSQLGVQVQFPTFDAASAYPPPDTPSDGEEADDATSD